MRSFWKLLLAWLRILDVAMDGCMCMCVYQCMGVGCLECYRHKLQAAQTLPAKVLQNKLLNWNWLEANWWRGVKRSWASEFAALIDVNCAQTPINAHACASKTIAGFSCLKCRCAAPTKIDTAVENAIACDKYCIIDLSLLDCKEQLIYRWVNRNIL